VYPLSSENEISVWCTCAQSLGRMSGLVEWNLGTLENSW